MGKPRQRRPTFSAGSSHPADSSAWDSDSSDNSHSTLLRHSNSSKSARQRKRRNSSKYLDTWARKDSVENVSAQSTRSARSARSSRSYHDSDDDFGFGIPIGSNLSQSSSSSLKSNPSTRRSSMDSSIDDVCMPLDDDVSEIGNEHTSWPDIQVLEEFAKKEREEDDALHISESYREAVNEATEAERHGRLRPRWHVPWTKDSALDTQNHMRFTYFRDDLYSTIHSPSISALLSPGQTFSDLFPVVLNKTKHVPVHHSHHTPQASQGSQGSQAPQAPQASQGPQASAASSVSAAGIASHRNSPAPAATSGASAASGIAPLIAQNSGLSRTTTNDACTPGCPLYVDPLKPIQPVQATQTVQTGSSAAEVPVNPSLPHQPVAPAMPAQAGPIGAVPGVPVVPGAPGVVGAAQAAGVPGAVGQDVPAPVPEHHHSHSMHSAHHSHTKGDFYPTISIDPASAGKIHSHDIVQHHDERGPWWLDINCPTEEEMRAISRTFGVHPLTTEDIILHETREKVELFHNYYFVCFTSFDVRVWDKKEESRFGRRDSEGQQSVSSRNSDGKRNKIENLRPLAVFSIVFHTGIITVHYRPTPHTVNVRRRIRLLRDYLNVTSDWISYALIDDITDGYGPLIESVDGDVQDIEDAILNMHGPSDSEDSVYDEKKSNHSSSGTSSTGYREWRRKGNMLRWIGESRKRVMSLLSLIGNKADVIKGFAKRVSEHWNGAPNSEIAMYLSDIQDHIVTMTQSLNHYEKLLARSHSNYLAQINIDMTRTNNEMNDVLSKITILGTIVLPINIVTGLWGMNVFVPGQTVHSLTWFYGIVITLLIFAISAYFLLIRLM